LPALWAGKSFKIYIYKFQSLNKIIIIEFEQYRFPALRAGNQKKRDFKISNLQKAKSKQCQKNFKIIYPALWAGNLKKTNFKISNF
jgi:hypothetical protein